MLRWNHFLIDPSKPESFPEQLPEWLRKVEAFSRFWFSSEDTWYARTSGSTSEPKTIPLSRNQIQASAEKSLRYFRHNPTEVGFALLIPADSAGGFMLLARAFLAKIDVLLLPPAMDSLNPELFPPDKKWFVSMLPLQFNSFLGRQDALAFSGLLSGILLGGGDLQITRMPEILQLLCPVFHSYGMTETASHIALRKIDSLIPEPFELLEDFEIRTDAGSCLEIKSPVITGGGWIKTSDLAEILPNGRFFIRGRAGNVINSGGLKIHPEVEKNNLSAMLPPEFLDFELLGIPDALLQEKMVMVLFGNPDKSVDFNKVTTLFTGITDKEKRKRLPKALFYMTDSRPLLEGGKTDFSALRKKIQEIEPHWATSKKMA